MSDVKRYTADIHTDWGAYEYNGMAEDIDGEWYKSTDYDTLMRALREATFDARCKDVSLTDMPTEAEIDEAIAHYIEQAKGE